MQAVAKRPHRGVFLFSTRFWLGFSLFLICASFLSADHYRPWVNFHAEAIAIAGALLGGTVLTLQRSFLFLPRFWLLWTGGAFMAALLQHWILPGIYLGDIAIAYIFLGALICAVAIGLHVGRSPDNFAPLTFGLLTLVSVLSGLIGILQWLSISDILGVFGVHTDFGDRAMGNLAQPNQLGTLLLMGLCSSAYFFDRQHLSRFTFLLIAALLTAALALTQSRTTLISATVLTAFACSLRVVHLRAQRQWVITWLISFWALFMAVPQINDWLLIGGGRDVPLTSSNSRDIVWKQTGYAIAQNPWMGYGWNRTATAHMAAAEALPGELTFNYAHNVFLDFLAWYGIPIGTALMCALAYWLWSRWKNIQNYIVGVHAYAAIIPFAIHSLLEFPFAYGYFLVISGILVGIIDALPGFGCVKTKRQAAIPILIGLSITGAIATYEYLKIEEDFRVARFSNMRIGRIPENYVYSNTHLLTQMGEMLQASRMRSSPGMPPEDIELLHRVAKRFPYGALTYRYIEALALNDQIHAAKNELKVLRGLYGARYYEAVKEDLTKRGNEHSALLLLLDN